MRRLMVIVALLPAFFAGAGFAQQPQDENKATTPQSQSESQKTSSTQTPPIAPAVSSSSGQLPSAKQAVPPAAAVESASVLKVTTRMVLLDIVATDSHGRPISDLEATDFTILEDGKPQKIRAFGYQHPVPADPKYQPLVLPPNVFTNIPRFQRTRSLNVVLLDALNTTLPDQVYVRQKMLRYLETMPADAPTAVFVLGQKLRMLQDFTTDPNLLRESVKKVNSQGSPLLDNPAGGPVDELLPPGLFDTLDPQQQESIQRFETERTSAQLDMRVRYTMDALQSIARALAGYRGRKNLVWISSSFPLVINPDATVAQTVEFEGTRNYADDIAKTAQILTDSEIAVYPVDARGLVVSSTFSAASTGRDRYGRSITSGPAFATAQSQESTQLVATHDAMNLLAERTGGKAYYNRNDIDNAIRDGLNDGSSYYMLGYYPENKEWNGKFRKLQVKVDKGGVKLRHRLGYYAADPAAVNSDPKLRAREIGELVSLDRPISTALFFQAGVIQPSEATKNRVVINYAVDGQALIIEHGNDGLEHADLECVAQAYSEKGKPINAAANTVQAKMKLETYREMLRSGFPCRNEIELTPGKYILRLVVRDDRSGLMGSANAKVSVPESAAVEKKTP